MARFPTLFLALLIASPALYAAFVTHQLDAQTGLLRLLIAVPVAAVMLALFRMVTRNYGKVDERKKDAASGSDPDEEPRAPRRWPANPSRSAAPRTPLSSQRRAAEYADGLDRRIAAPFQRGGRAVHHVSTVQPPSGCCPPVSRSRRPRPRRRRTTSARAHPRRA